MMALMNPRVWAAVALAAVLAFTHAFVYRAGKAVVQAERDKDTKEQLRASVVAEQENRRMESLRAAKVIEAQNAQTKRTQTLQASAAGARTELDRLRDAVAAIPADLPGQSGNAAGNPASTPPGLLAECSRAYQELAAKADGHYSDALTLQQAWPK